MSWTVACFRGTVFSAPANRCPTCHAAVPSVSTGASTAEMTSVPDVVDELLRSRAGTRRSGWAISRLAKPVALPPRAIAARLIIDASSSVPVLDAPMTQEESSELSASLLRTERHGEPEESR